MKKFFLLLLFVCLTIVTTAQAEWFRTSHYKISPYPTVNWSDWQPLEIDVLVNAKSHHIEIHSLQTQIIDYQTLTKFEYENCDAYGAYATDSNYDIIYIVMYFFYSGEVQLEVRYSDLIYRYQLE